MDGWLTKKASRGIERLSDLLNLSDGAEDFLRMIQREFCQADNLYNRIHRGQQAADAAADSVRAAGGTLDELDDIGQEIAEDAVKADNLPARKDPGSAGGVGIAPDTLDDLAQDVVRDAAKADDILPSGGSGKAGGAGAAGGSGGSTSKSNQVHHYATNKNKVYTPQFEEIANKYGLDLNGDWNKELLPHQGRHANAYQEYVLASMKQFDEIAQGNKDIFFYII